MGDFGIPAPLRMCQSEDMSTLSGTSTDAEVWDSYDDNASYEEDGSTTKAKAFITACRILRRRRPSSLTREGRSASYESLAQDIKEAQAWLESATAAASSSGGRVRYLAMENYRG
jgi:hypothetical protein